MAAKIKEGFVHQWPQSSKNSLCGTVKRSQRNKILREADKMLPCPECTKLYAEAFLRRVRGEYSELFPKYVPPAVVSFEIKRKVYLGLLH